MDVITQEKVRIDMIFFLMDLKDMNVEMIIDRRIKQINWQRIATQGGYESLATDEDSWAREFAATYGFHQLPEKIQNDLLGDGYSYVRMAAQVSQISQTMGGIFLPSLFLNFTNLSKNV